MSAKNPLFQNVEIKFDIREISKISRSCYIKHSKLESYSFCLPTSCMSDFLANYQNNICYFNNWVQKGYNCIRSPIGKYGNASGFSTRIRFK